MKHTDIIFSFDICCKLFWWWIILFGFKKKEYFPIIREIMVYYTNGILVINSYSKSSGRFWSILFHFFQIVDLISNQKKASDWKIHKTNWLWSQYHSIYLFIFLGICLYIWLLQWWYASNFVALYHRFRNSLAQIEIRMKICSLVNLRKVYHLFGIFWIFGCKYLYLYTFRLWSFLFVASRVVIIEWRNGIISCDIIKTSLEIGSKHNQEISMKLFNSQ